MRAVIVIPEESEKSP
jgi:hypothetical protein